MDAAIRRYRADQLRAQAAMLVIQANGLCPHPDDQRIACAITWTALDQAGHHGADAMAGAVAPQSGQDQSIDSGRGVHGDDSAAEGAPCT